MMLSASIIIPNLHSPHLGDVIQGLRRQTVAPLEVIVVGQDRHGLAREDGWVRVFPSPQPAPPAVARNVGIAYARGDVCCFLDSDCVPVDDWLERLLAQHESGHVAVGGGIAIGGESFWQRCDNIASMGPFLATAPAGERMHLITANAAIRRDLLRAVGGFDQQFLFPSGEDTDLSFRLRQQHEKLFFEPAATVIHRTSRAGPLAIWKHIWLYGYQWELLQERYSDLLGTSYWQKLCRYSPVLALLLVPLLTLLDTYHIYAQQLSPQKSGGKAGDRGGPPGTLWVPDHPPAKIIEKNSKYWTTVPFVYWARMAWYIGRMAYINGQAE